MHIDFSRISSYIPFIIEGAYVTIFLALISTILGVIIAIILALSKSSNIVVRSIAYFYTDILRGTPVLLQLAIIYFAVPQLFGITLDAMSAAIITFSFNSGAYLSETIRGGIERVDRGQIEAAKALGIPQRYIFIDIILPQAFKNVLPAIVNEISALIKETAIVSLIGLQDIMKRQQMVSGSTYLYFEPLIVAGVLYYFIVKPVSTLGKYLEGRLN